MIKHEEKVDFVSPIHILDTEISNNIFGENKFIDYKSAKLCTLGILVDNKIIILQKEKKDSEELFYKDCVDLLKDKHICFAFNASFDKEIIFRTLKKSMFMEEIKPFKGKNASVNELFKVIVKDKKIEQPEDLMKSGAGVENAYAENDYKKIILHNRADLIKEYHLFMNRFYLREKYQNKIDSKGWYQGVFGENDSK